MCQRHRMRGAEHAFHAEGIHNRQDDLGFTGPVLSADDVQAVGKVLPCSKQPLVGVDVDEQVPYAQHQMALTVIISVAMVSVMSLPMRVRKSRSSCITVSSFSISAIQRLPLAVICSRSPPTQST